MAQFQVSQQLRLSESGGRFNEGILGYDPTPSKQFCPLIKNQGMGNAVLGFNVAGKGFLEMFRSLAGRKLHFT